MNITFLIGNGFDIGLGLKTKYEDFYKEYCVINNDDNNNIKNFKEILKKRNNENDFNIVDWSDFELAFGLHSRDFSIHEKELYIERFEDFVYKFNEYLEKEEAKLDYSNEVIIVETMEKAINTYFHIRNDDRHEIEKIYNSMKSKRIYNFISFNYTRSIDNCANIISNKWKENTNKGVGKCVHIHGYIDANMIMGVNDASQIVVEEFSKDNNIINTIVKPKQNIDSRTGYEREVIPLIRNSDIICIYGMSIGATDKKWWNIISHWLAGNYTRKLVILLYDKEYNPRFTFNQLKIINRVVDRFLSYSDLSDNKIDDIRSRICVGVNHNVFSMQLIKENNQRIDENVMYRLESLENEMSKKISIDDDIIINGGTSKC